MRSDKKELIESQLERSMQEFLKSYNENIPASFPRATIALLQKFKDEHILLFKHGDAWSLDQHRKKIMDWLPRNGAVA